MYAILEILRHYLIFYFDLLALLVPIHSLEMFFIYNVS